MSKKTTNFIESTLNKEHKAVISVADVLTPLGIHVVEVKGSRCVENNNPLNANECIIQPGIYEELDLRIYVPL